ncbi:high choriolytic enzyme 1 isoform X2 [Chanos chanos]|uniref:Metalloendopeptidase n=1 Tax=Chanos chanos TaxID=29144 RepID=A0A6J2USB3_CHACN|nr:high choriolytic enzyme 1-like isoform X2 [Chanos chanos]
MNLRASLSLLVLLLGLSQAIPENEIEDNFLPEEEETVDMTARILDSNKRYSEVLVEGDLVVPKTRTAVNCWNNHCLWKKSSNGLVEVPYTLSSDFSYYEKMKLEYALATFHRKTCVRFVPRSSQNDYVSIENRNGCFSSLGRSGGKQVVSLNKYGCLHNGIIQHELSHALGFYHEQTRSDRDQYVRINWEYISPSVAYNFYVQNTNNLDTPYDYSSVMHYGRTAFSNQYGKETITPIPDESVQIGQSQGLSDIDILRINKLYDCNM